MDIQEKAKAFKIHRGVVIARWIWIIFGYARGEFMSWMRTQSLSPLAPSPKYLGAPIMLLLAIYQVLFNLLLSIYLRRNKNNITEFGYKILNFLQVFGDLFSFILIFCFSGSIEGPGVSMLFVPLIISLIIYRQRGITITAITGIALYSGLVIGQYLHIIPHHHAYITLFSETPTDNLFIVVYNISTFMMSYAGAAIFGSLVSRTIYQREQELVLERDKTNSMIRNLSDGIVLISETGIISAINDKTKEYLKIDDKVIGLHSEKDFSNLPLNLQKIIISPADSIKRELTLEEKNEPLTLEITTATVRAENDKTYGLMKIIHDITREKEIDRLKTEFISVASHQLRTPLSAIKWTMQMMLEGDLGPLNPDQKNFMEKGYHSNEQMIRLVNDLLDVSRIEEGRFLYTFKALDLTQVVQKAVDASAILIERMKAKGINFVFEKPATPLPPSQLDEEKLQLVILNLIENATNYTDKGEIKVSLHFDEKTKNNILEISDSGAGIPIEDQQRLFNKFYRASNVVKMQTEGSGLGLFIAKNITKKHNGNISFKSTEGKGTTFIVSIPAITLPPGQELSKEQYDNFVQGI